MTSGELAKVTGVSVDTLHHYEKRRVLQPPARGLTEWDQKLDAATPAEPARLLESLGRNV